MLFVVCFAFLAQYCCVPVCACVRLCVCMRVFVVICVHICLSVYLFGCLLLAACRPTSDPHACVVLSWVFSRNGLRATRDLAVALVLPATECCHALTMQETCMLAYTVGSWCGGAAAVASSSSSSSSPSPSSSSSSLSIGVDVDVAEADGSSAASDGQALLPRGVVASALNAISARVVELASRVSPTGVRALQLQPPAISTLLWAVARSGVPAPADSLPMVASLLAAIPRVAPGFDVHQLALTVWAMVKCLDAADPGSVRAFDALVAELATRDLTAFPSQSLALAAWSLSNRNSAFWEAADGNDGDDDGGVVGRGRPPRSRGVVPRAVLARVVAEVTRWGSTRPLEPTHTAMLTLALGRYHGATGEGGAALQFLSDRVSASGGSFSQVDTARAVLGFAAAATGPKPFLPPTPVLAVVAARLAVAGEVRLSALVDAAVAALHDVKPGV